MLIGALAVLAASSLYAVSSMLVKLEAPRLGVVAQNAYRLTAASLAMSVIFLLTSDLARLGQVPPAALAALVAAVLCGLVVGDTLNYRAVLLIGLGRAFTIANAYPLPTLLVAALFLDEQVGWREVIGCLVTLVGVTLVALPGRRERARPLERRANLIGVGLALVVAVLWAGANSFAKLALLGMDTVTANAIRLPIAAAIAWLMLGRSAPQPPPWRLAPRTLAAVIATGLLSSVVGGLLTLYGVQAIGAARAAILGATSPLFAVPLSLAILKERLAPRMIVGTLLSVAGIALIIRLD